MSPTHTCRRRFMQAITLHAMLVLIALVITGCDPIVENRGHKEDVPIADIIKPSVSTREEVAEKLGSPSTQSSFGEETWYYITAVRHSRAILAPEITQQNVTRIVFDPSGIVKSVNQYTLDDSKDIEVVTRETPTEGHSLGFIEQVMGNLGRFNKTDKSKSSTSNNHGRK